MANFSEKLQANAEKKRKVLEETAQLIEKQKKSIGALVQKIGLLEAPDDFLAGLLLEGKKTLESKGKAREELEALGAGFLKKRRGAKAAAKAQSPA